MIACAKTPPDAARTERAASTPAPLEPARAPARIRVPEGSFLAGTEPGRDERQPELEPRLERIALGSFEIDTSPYPGGGAAPRLGLPRARARELCAARQGRLCTELEWERACKGPESQRFAGSDGFDATCRATAAGCRSGFGVYGLGNLREWTDSDVAGAPAALAAVRGAQPGQGPAQQRCAHRSAVAALDAPADIGFRCCQGAPNAARVQIPGLGPTYRKLALPLDRLAQLLAESPVTARLAAQLGYFEDPAAAAAVLARGSGDRQGFSFGTDPLLWSPARGAEFLVASARSGETTSFVVVFHALGGDRYRLASSFVMEGEAGPVALAYNGYLRPRLHFSTCWGCPGETGKILYREPDSAVILQP